jgi:hypothetical protein
MTLIFSILAQLLPFSEDPFVSQEEHLKNIFLREKKCFGFYFPFFYIIISA